MRCKDIFKCHSTFMQQRWQNRPSHGTIGGSVDGYQFSRGLFSSTYPQHLQNCRIFENRSKGLAMRMLQCNSKNLESDLSLYLFS